jgi:hypothetical protein
LPESHRSSPSSIGTSAGSMLNNPNLPSPSAPTTPKGKLSFKSLTTRRDRRHEIPDLEPTAPRAPSQTSQTKSEPPPAPRRQIISSLPATPTPEERNKPLKCVRVLAGQGRAGLPNDIPDNIDTSQSSECPAVDIATIACVHVFICLHMTRAIPARESVFFASYSPSAQMRWGPQVRGSITVYPHI